MAVKTKHPKIKNNFEFPIIWNYRQNKIHSINNKFIDKNYIDIINKVKDISLKDYKKYGVDYYVSYYAVIKKNGSSTIKRYETSLFRKIRDFTLIKTYQIINRF